jgi:hypothetical protein
MTELDPIGIAISFRDRNKLPRRQILLSVVILGLDPRISISAHRAELYWVSWGDRSGLGPSMTLREPFQPHSKACPEAYGA